MCLGCYKEYDSPEAYTDTTWTVVDLIGKVYNEDMQGGNLHAVLDDWNLEDDHFDYPLQHPDTTDTERELATLMLAMTEDERATALALYEGFITPDLPKEIIKVVGFAPNGDPQIETADGQKATIPFAEAYRQALEGQND